MERYIGLDVHAASTTAAVLDARGKRVGPPHVLETNGQVLVEFFKLQPGTLHVCLEEGTQSTWLAEILAPHVAELVVTHVGESRGPKDDARDAYALAERLRTGAVTTTVFKGQGAFATLRHLVKVHDMVVRDTVRVQNRIKALFRSRGIPVRGKEVYAAAHRAAWLAKLPDSSRGAADILFAQYDAQREVRTRAKRELATEARRHEAARWLASCPGMGAVRVAQLLAIVVVPERFRTRQQLGSYAGLGIVMRSSSDGTRDAKGGWARARVQSTRGLNLNCNRTLKQVVKGAATTVIRQLHDAPLYKDDERMLAGGTKPNLAKVSLARKIAATTLAMWKHKEVYDPAKHATPSSSRVSGRRRARSDGRHRRVCRRGPSRVGFGGKHPLLFWTRSTARSARRGPQSPRRGYAPPENRTKPWHIDALIAGWFPHSLRENETASRSAGSQTRHDARRNERCASPRPARWRAMRTRPT